MTQHMLSLIRCGRVCLCVSAGLDEAMQRLSEQKVDASGMDIYTHEMSKVCPDAFDML